MSSWAKNRKLYTNWLTDTGLKCEFAKKIKIDNLSLWWATKLVDRDNINETSWYLNLDKKINGDKIKTKNFYLTLLFLIFKLLKKLLFKIIIIIFIKLFFKKKKIVGKKKSCLYSLLANFKLFDNKFVDYQYGKFGYKNSKGKVYYIDMTESFYLIFNYFSIKKNLKKIPLDYVIDQHNVNLIDILKIYFFVLKKLFTAIRILKKKKYFYINKINCENILKIRLIESFFGTMQDQLIKGCTLNKVIKNLQCTNFISYFEFYPRSRVLYYYAKEAKVKNVISFQHGNPYDSNLSLNIKKKDYSNNNDFKFYSPKPDVICCQGEKYFKKMKSIFSSNKIYKVGSFKIELPKRYKKVTEKNNTSLKLEKNKILIILGVSDYKGILKLLNKCNLKNFNIFISVHPVDFSFTKNYIKNNFIHSFILAKPNITNSFGKKDYIIFGESTLGIEMALKKFNIFRVYDKEFNPSFDVNKEILTATTPRAITKILKNNINNKIHLIKKDYFFKYDYRASVMFSKILDKNS